MLDLALVKKHLNIDEDFTDDDEYLNHLIQVATQAVDWQIDAKQEDPEEQDPEQPQEEESNENPDIVDPDEGDNETEDEESEPQEDEIEVPEHITHAILLLIGELYNNREITTPQQVRSLPKAYDYLVGISKRYTIA